MPLGCYDLSRRRTPGPPPLGSMNSTPACSSVWRIAAMVALRGIL